MCRFFTVKNFMIGMGAASVIAPIIFTAVMFSIKENVAGAISASWIIGASVSLLAGYYVGSERKCLLPHIPLEMEIEGMAIEGLETPRGSIVLRM